MGRPKKYTDEGQGLFDNLEPLTIPQLTTDQLTSHDDFVIKSREALGKISILANACLDQTMTNKAPRHDLADYLVKMTRAVNLAIISNTQLTSNQEEPADPGFSINFIKKSTEDS